MGQVTWAWPVVDRVPALEAGEVQVRLVELKGTIDPGACFEVLSDGERRRTERFTHTGVREEYAVSRGVLRILLAGYVGIEPRDLRFRNAPGGKPFLVETGGRPTPQFNMTHSQGVALYAFAIDQAVGVDVETADRRVRAEGIAKRFFTARESEAILALPEARRKEAFVRTWTCKEASLKWTGMGLRGGLRTHEIGFDSDWENPKATGEGAQPALTMLAPGAGWVGALATDRVVEVDCGVWVG